MSIQNFKVRWVSKEWMETYNFYTFNANIYYYCMFAYFAENNDKLFVWSFQFANF